MVENEANQNRVVVRRAISVWTVKLLLFHRFEGHIIVENISFVSIDIPEIGIQNIGSKFFVCQGVIQIARTPVINVAIGIISAETFHQVDDVICGTGDTIRAKFDCVDGVFFGIGIEVTDNDVHTGTRVGWVCFKPVHQNFRCSGTGKVTVALTITEIRIALASGTFRFEVVHRNGKDFISDFVFKACREAGSVAGSVIGGVKSFIQNSKGTNLVNFGRFVDESLFDSIRANVTRRHVGISTRRGSSVEAFHKVNNRGISCNTWMFVFDFNQTDHIRFHTQNSSNDFIALAGKFFRCIRATATHVSSRPTNITRVIDGHKVVEHVQAGNADFACHE